MNIIRAPVALAFFATCSAAAAAEGFDRGLKSEKIGKSMYFYPVAFMAEI